MPGTEHFVFRLKPGQDLKKSIQDFVDEQQIAAGWICTCIGSLTNYSIRFANQKMISAGAGHFEILYLSGTVSTNGSHLHICIADEQGRTIGGHLSDGCVIYSTAEIVLGSSGDLIFAREPDKHTGFVELAVRRK